METTRETNYLDAKIDFLHDKLHKYNSEKAEKSEDKFFNMRHKQLQDDYFCLIKARFICQWLDIEATAGHSRY